MNIVDEAEQEALEIERVYGHTFKRYEEGGIDLTAMDADYHSGPSCTRCWFCYCEFCGPGKDIPACYPADCHPGCEERGSGI